LALGNFGEIEDAAIRTALQRLARATESIEAANEAQPAFRQAQGDDVVIAQRIDVTGDGRLQLWGRMLQIDGDRIIGVSGPMKLGEIALPESGTTNAFSLTVEGGGGGGPGVNIVWPGAVS
jgi:hypothetical protein